MADRARRGRAGLCTIDGGRSRLSHSDAPGARRGDGPDFSARPQIIDRTAIVYYDTHGTTYVGRFKGGCPKLADYRRITTRRTGARLCANDAVHIAEETGGDLGFCTFSGFTPYRKR